MAIVPPSITNATVVCAECGRIATGMCPTQPDGHLLCICRPCDLSWFALDPAGYEDGPAKLDGCPECLTRNNTPAYAFRAGAGSVCCYTCRACGHSWWTGWSAL